MALFGRKKPDDKPDDQPKDNEGADKSEPKVELNALQKQFEQAAQFMRAGQFKKSLEILEPLGQNPDALVQAQVSRTLVAFCIAVNHIELGDNQVSASAQELESIASNEKKNPRLRIEALQMLTGLYLDSGLRLSAAKEPEKQAKASAYIQKAKNFAEKAMTIDDRNPLARLAASYVAIHDKRVPEAAKWIDQIAAPKIGNMARRMHGSVMEEVSAHLLGLDLDGDDEKSADPNNDSSVEGFSYEPDDKPTSGPTSGSGDDAGDPPKDNNDDDLGGPGGAGKTAPLKPKPGTPGMGAKPARDESRGIGGHGPNVRERPEGLIPLEVSQPKP